MIIGFFIFPLLSEVQWGTVVYDSTILHPKPEKEPLCQHNEPLEPEYDRSALADIGALHQAD